MYLPPIPDGMIRQATPTIAKRTATIVVMKLPLKFKKIDDAPTTIANMSAPIPKYII